MNGQTTLRSRRSQFAPLLRAVYEPGRRYGDAGQGILYWPNPLPPALEELAVELAGRDLVGETDGRGTARYTGPQFVEVVRVLARRNTAAGLAPETLLLVRAFRFAARLVELGDVLPFAAPDIAARQEALGKLAELSWLTDEGWSAWSRYGDHFVARWVPSLAQMPARALRTVLLDAAQALWGRWWRRGMGWQKRDHARLVLDSWLVECVDRIVRAALVDVDGQGFAASPWRVMYRGETELLARWREALTGDDAGFNGDGWLVWRILRRWWDGAGWDAVSAQDVSGSDRCHLEVELVPPDGAAQVSGRWQLRVYVAHDQWPATTPLTALWRRPDRSLPVGRERLKGPETWALARLWKASEAVPALRRLVSRPLPGCAELAEDEAVDLLVEQLPLLREQGFTVRAPQWLPASTAGIRIRVRVDRLRARSTRTTSGSGSGWMSRDQLIDFDWSVVIDGHELSRQEFERLVEQKRPLLRLEGAWRLVPVEAVLQQVEQIVGRRGAGSVSLTQLIQGVLDAEQATSEETVIPVEWTFSPEAAPVRRLLSELERARQPEQVDPPAAFRGTLREYQRAGLSWLVHLRRIGFGGCLADDMGLGKTIQVIAYLLYLKAEGLCCGPHLLVCPTSLISNWRSELRRFAPSLRVHVHHGTGRLDSLEGNRTVLAAALEDADLVLTTYATAARDVEVLRGVAWDVVIADEAQNIKNAQTKQARAMRALPARQRVALTGTPMENRLEELWSILHFVNPGYLGSLSWFRKTFVQPIAVRKDAQAARRLQRVLRPVLLRRTKTDKAIQLELPEKWEVREYAGLTPEQAALYQGIVDQLFRQVRGNAGGMARRGQILAALVRLKQVCDHPCLVVGGRADPDRSAKLKLLLDRLEEVAAQGERALVFTQFRDMGELLCDALEQRFGVRPRFLHGGQSAGERGRIVEAFQSREDSAPVLILSLKAGGVGLNLTEASHVFHYDRWWNPAVEDQATDRVYRIGQVKNVQVHKLVCAGTLEERIDELITAKRQLSERVVGESEAWLTELDDETLRALFELDLQAAEVAD